MNINKQTLKLYWKHVRNHKRTFFAMLFCIPLGALTIDTLLPYVLSQAIQAIQDSNSLMPTLIVAGAVGLIGALLNFIGFQSMSRHEANVIADLRQSTFESLIRKDHAFFVDQKVGAMTSRFIDFVRAEVTLQDLIIIRTLGFILSVGSGIIILGFHSLLVAGIILALIVALLLQVRWSIRRRAPLRHERKTLVSEIHGLIADDLTNNLTVRTFAGEKEEIKTLKKLTDRFKKIYIKDIGFVAAEGSTRVAVMIIVQIIAVGIAAIMIQQGQLSLAIGIFILAYMQRIGSQLFILGEMLNGYDQALLDAQPMTEMLLINNQVVESPAAEQLTISKPAIVFDDVSFRYSDGTVDVVDDLQITIPAGQKVGLVGHSGAGKSTLVQLLLRFYDPTKGAVKIDSQNIAEVAQESLRSGIAYVPQEPMLFHRSLRENIAYGKPNATDEEILRAAKQAHALEFIEQLPDGLDTTVGERGVKLSGGQRQRIAIARAILKDAPILVLDEATSALDSESEKLIQQSLETLMKGRTSIVIAHRLSTIAKLDRIIVLDKGKIVEDGSHDELLKKKGTYAKLWAHQSGGFIEE